MGAKSDEEISALSNEISRLKVQLEELEAQSLIMKTKLETEFQEKLTELENKFLTEKQEIERSHEQMTQELRAQMTQEGQELSEKKVCFH
jgi:archaellum component FlaC